MRNFWEGFDKKAAEDKPRSWDAKRLIVPGAALAAGAGTYALKRSGGKGKSLVRQTMIHVGRQPKKWKKPSAVKQWVLNQLYGGDKVIPVHRSHQPLGGGGRKYRRGYISSIPKHELSKDELAIASNMNMGKKVFKGKAEFIGSGMTSPIYKQLRDKFHEQKLLSKYAPGASIDSYKISKGKKGLKELHRKLSPKESNYFIKKRDSVASGVGGGGFVNKKDVEKYLSGGRVDKDTEKAIKKITNHPEEYVAQPDVKIKKTLFTKKNKEFRVHAINGKVVPGATSTRGGNIESIFAKRKAEKFFQGVLNKLPSKYKKNIAMSPDIAMTEKGFKVIETNSGGLSSGLANPSFTYRSGGLPAAMDSWLNSASIYKHMTGKSTQLTSGLTAAGVAGGAYGIGKKVEDKYGK